MPAFAADKPGTLPDKIVVNKNFVELLNGTEAVPVVVTINTLRRASARDLLEPASRAAVKAGIAADLDAAVAGLVPGRNVLKLTTSPRFATRLTPAEIKALAASPTVASIEYDIQVEKHLDQAIPIVQANTVHSAGGNGRGLSVAIIDDGAQRSHPFLGNRHIAAAEACFIAGSSACPNGTGSQIGAGASEAAPGQSHGTHVAGITVGRRSGAAGPRTGVAFASRYIPINVFGPFGSTGFSNLDRAFEHVEDLVLEGNNRYKIAAVNMSIGGNRFRTECDSALPNTKAVLERLRALGIPVAISAGNNSWDDDMGAPGCISTAVSVASVGKTSARASYSNINRTTDLFSVGGEFGDCVVSSVQTNAFDAFCGTSMSSPMVAGQFAVLKQLFPNATPAQMLAALQRTGQAITTPVHTKPLTKLERARQFLLNPTPPTNDAFAKAVNLPLNGYLAGNNTYATRQTGERRHVTATDGQTIWYKIRVPTGGSVTIDTLGSDFDTVLAVYSETSLAALSTPVAANNDVGGAQKASTVSFNADRNRLYYVAVGGAAPGEEGHVVISTAVQPLPPTNDAFASSRAVSSPPVGGAVALRSSNLLATTEAGEPIQGFESATVWYRFRTSAAGRWIVETAQSDFDTTLAVYDGTTLQNLNLVLYNDDRSATDRTSRVVFTGVANKVYFVQVGGYNNAQGNIRLRIAAPRPAPGAAVEEVSLIEMK
ncbi:S8 family serine peptidase [Methylobrevis sp. L22]|uniref:S8 family serine peptidase n=1 Tax=Methylobrevis albus TaxID=2793297 RepID=A0A931MY02_9HYPH|nr:S8 family serine peptidase [Methylobrevis albus]